MTAALVCLHPPATDAPLPDPGSLPSGMVRAAALGLRSPPTLLHRQIAERIAADALTDDDVDAIAEYGGTDAALLCLGGPVGRLWADERIADRARAHPLAWLFAGSSKTRESAWDEGTRYWLARERSLRVPAELRLARVMASLYRTWAKRIAATLPALLGNRSGRMDATTRDLTAAEILALFDTAEGLAELKAQMGPQLSKVVELAFTDAAKEMGLSGALKWSPAYVSPAGAIGTKIINVPETVARGVEWVVNKGLMDGATVAEMQAAIKGLPEMSVGRALTVARTESARVVTQGQNVAMKEAKAAGARVKRRWVSARDAAVRPSHRALEGQEVEVNEPWKLSDGTPTQGPGQSGVASEDINCRCAMRPVVIREPKP